VKLEITRCDRCRQETEKPVHATFEGDIAKWLQTMDLCERCWYALSVWISPSNDVSPGDSRRPQEMRGPGWRAHCSHHIPCGGSCPDPRWERVT